MRGGGATEVGTVSLGERNMVGGMLRKEKASHRKPAAGAAVGQTKEGWEEKGIPGGGWQGQET